MKRLLVMLAVLLSIVSESATAGGSQVISVPTGGGGNYTETKGYAGLAWVLGAKKSALIPDLVVGVRSMKVKVDDRISNGADLSARFSFIQGFSFDSFRLNHVFGKRDLLGNVGVGYSFTNSTFLSTLAAQGAHSRGGVDYEFTSNKLLPYFELISIGTPKRAKASGSQLVCDDDLYSLPDNPKVGDSCISDL